MGLLGRRTMQYEWFTLPGPRKVLDSICDELDQGRNLVLTIPGYVRGHLPTLLRAKIAEMGLVWRNVEVDPAQRPLDSLLGHLPLSERYGIGEEEDFSLRSQNLGAVFWVETAPSHEDEWLRFLDQHARISRSLESGAPALFCVAVAESISAKRVREDVLLKVMRWSDCLCRLDIEGFALHNRHRDAAPYLRSCIAAIIASLAGNDLAVVECLMQWPLDSLLAPRDTIAELEKCAECRVHPCHLFALDEYTTKTRLWQAEIREFFPFIDCLRRYLIHENARWLKVPFVVKRTDGREYTITNVHDLELGHLVDQLRDGGRDSDAVMLARMRNILAHLDTLSSRDFANPQLQMLYRRAETWLGDNP